MMPSKTLNLVDYIGPIIEPRSQKIDSRIIVVDKNNIVIEDSNSAHIGQEFKHSEINDALKGKNVHGLYNFKKLGHVLYTAVPIKLDNEIVGAVLISASINSVYEELAQINNKLILISVTSIIFIALLSFIFASYLSSPIERFTRIISQISQDKLNQRIKMDTNDEFKKMADSFNIMLNKLDQVDKQRKDFVANVSHELRTPLSSMKLLSESLIHQEESNIDIYKEFLKDINSEVNRLNNIIDDLLYLVDLDKEKLTLNYGTTYINFLLERIVTRLQPLAKEKSIDLELKLKEKVQISIDSDKIQQSIINIIHNAIKYTPKEGQVKVSLYTKGKNAIIEIKDNGIGIDKESLSHVFDRFYRVDKARARNTGGTGLGLSIAYQIVSLHQGTIKVESEVGEGSTFYIMLPTDIGID
ncbi:MAG: cell wall metabolism sensor histidine kinase WalK [Firmicutes bacterium]|nr:cell wall metabolism sensor histidine kinase WalK [Bacillota bacterium]